MDATDPHARALRLRATNLGLDRWELLARGRPGSAVADVANHDLRCLVLDLGSLATREEQAVAAEAVLAVAVAGACRPEAGAHRHRRGPQRLPAGTRPTECTALASEHVARIAGEGRKFGLYLLVATQRPQKVHENVLTQCDNLVLLRMNSQAEPRLHPRHLLARSGVAARRGPTVSDQGEALSRREGRLAPVVLAAASEPRKV